MVKKSSDIFEKILLTEADAASVMQEAQNKIEQMKVESDNKIKNLQAVTKELAIKKCAELESKNIKKIADFTKNIEESGKIESEKLKKDIQKKEYNIAQKILEEILHECLS